MEEKHIFAICFLADKMKRPPREVQSWDIRDRQLMLAYYQVEAERKR